MKRDNDLPVTSISNLSSNFSSNLSQAEQSENVPADKPILSVIIVSYNTRDILRRCLHRLFAEIKAMSSEKWDIAAPNTDCAAQSVMPSVQVIVIDNASSDGSGQMVMQEFPEIQLFNSASNLGFAAANNLGFSCAKGEYIVLLNPDAFLTKGALSQAIKQMQAKPHVGMAGGLLQDQNGHWQPSGRMFPSLFNECLVLTGLAARFPKSRLFGRFDRTWANHLHASQVDWIPGAFTIICQRALRKVGKVDERFFLYYEEVDVCRRMHEAGYEVWYWPNIVITHIGGESAKTVKHTQFSNAGSQLSLWRMRSALLYYRKHHGRPSAWLAAQLEIAWNRLRLIKSSLTSQWFNKPTESQLGHNKIAQLKRNISLMQQAWQETHGGTTCPPKPW